MLEVSLINFVIFYVISINLYGFIVFGLDKRYAKTGRRRISEHQLLTIALYGGFFGTLGGMSFRRHKTSKSSFLRKFWLIGFVWTICLLVFLILYPLSYQTK